MDYFIFTKNKSINDWINYCLSIINSDDKPQFKKEFKSYSGSDFQSLHVFRELILGAYLISNGIAVRYNYKIFNKKPDWSIINENSSTCKGIIELVNLDIDQKTNDYIEKQRIKNEIAVYWTGINKKRLYERLQSKATIYKDLLKNFAGPYVISVFVDFRLHFDMEEVNHLLNNNSNGLFQMYNTLSGVLYFCDSNGKYFFNYFENHIANNKIHLPSGEFNQKLKTRTEQE